jgi:cytochrome P450
MRRLSILSGQMGKAMRITRPSTDVRVRLDEIDLTDIGLYVDGDPHLVWQTLRAERPVFWQSRSAGEGFWAVTRYEDVRRVLSEYETFTSESGTAIAMLDAVDPSAGHMMQATDPPRHRQFRQQIGKQFSVNAITSLTEQVRQFVRTAMSPALDGQVWDVAESFARLPMEVGALMMGLPEQDIDPLLNLAYASLAPHDARYRSDSAKNNYVSAHYEIIRYFSRHIEERRENNPVPDVIGHLMTMEIDGQLMSDEDVIINCLSLLLGAVVTTSHAINATLIALAEQNGGEGRWPEVMPIRTTVDEALRWASPVTHFMRRARRDVELHGETIKAGDAVTAWIASANRDESFFPQPYALDFERSPNHHVVFGYGAHRCLGSNVARLMLQESFAEMIADIESFELAGAPRHLASNEIAGIVSLPIRVNLRTERATHRPPTATPAVR